mmetsp:Transcript_5957/g.8846  ORF Transcript_5957/g.8846 Transcript_5957/m.8846 type:complete len:359 (-) Transcript_5957:119-1195(-)
MRHDSISKQRLEFSPSHIPHLFQNILPRPPWLHGCINTQQIRRLGPLWIIPLQTLHYVRLTLLDLLPNKLGRVQNVNPRIIIRITLGHLILPIRQTHHPRPALLDNHRLRFGEGRVGRYARLLAPLLKWSALIVHIRPSSDDVPRKFEMLSLIFTDWDTVGLIEEDVGRHEDGVGEESDADGVGSSLTCFVLELDHTFEPVHGRGTIEEPAEFRVCRDVRLDEYFGFCGVNSSSKVKGGTTERTLLQILWIMRHGNRMQIHDTKIILRNDLHTILNFWFALGILELHPLTNGTEVISQMERSSGLNAREDSACLGFELWRWGGGGGGRLSGCFCLCLGRHVVDDGGDGTLCLSLCLCL